MKKNSVLMKVCLVLVALGMTTSVASAAATIVRVNYDYFATGENGSGQGLWSVTLDSGLISQVAGTPVTFLAPMATPTFKQREPLLAGDVKPGTPFLAGWTNDEHDKGADRGMEWKFYESSETVTLYSITEGYTEYTWDIQTQLAGHADDNLLDLQNNYYFRFNIADNPGGLDIEDEDKLQAVTWWGDVDRNR